MDSIEWLKRAVGEEGFGEKGDLNPEQRRYAVSGFTNLVWLTCVEH